MKRFFFLIKFFYISIKIFIFIFSILWGRWTNDHPQKLSQFWLEVREKSNFPPPNFGIYWQHTRTYALCVKFQFAFSLKYGDFDPFDQKLAWDTSHSPFVLVTKWQKLTAYIFQRTTFYKGKWKIFWNIQEYFIIQLAIFEIN